MSKDYSKYLRVLAAEHNILYIGKDSEEVYDKTSSYFKTSSKIDINEKMLEKITSTLIKRHITVVVIDVQNNNELSVDFYKKIRAFNEEIPILLMFNPKEYRKLFEIVPLVDATVSYPIDRDIFHKKLFTVLSQIYTINSIGQREIVLQEKNTIEEVSSIDIFFDKYEGSSLFIADDLKDIVDALNAGNLTHPFLSNIAQRLDDVAEIFSKAEQTRSVTPIYEDLASYLRGLDLEKIEPQNLKGFSYLTDILNDVSAYLMNMFVDRIFKDVQLFEYSLQDNIKFMKNQLQGSENSEGEVDFF